MDLKAYVEEMTDNPSNDVVFSIERIWNELETRFGSHCLDDDDERYEIATFIVQCMLAVGLTTYQNTHQKVN